MSRAVPRCPSTVACAPAAAVWTEVHTPQRRRRRVTAERSERRMRSARDPTAGLTSGRSGGKVRGVGRWLPLLFVTACGADDLRTSADARPPLEAGDAPGDAAPETDPAGTEAPPPVGAWSHAPRSACPSRARLRGRGKSAPASGARTGRPWQSVDALPYNPAGVTYALAKRVLCLLRSRSGAVHSPSHIFICQT